MKIVREGDFEFDFSRAWQCDKLDRQDNGPKPEGMKFVDIVVEEEQQLLLIEVKSTPPIPQGTDARAYGNLEKKRREFLQRLMNNSLICDELTPKARDSYSFLHLMGRDAKPMRFVFLVGIHNLDIPFHEAQFVASFQDRLAKRLRQEAAVPWVKQYVADCLVLTEATWGRAFPQYSLRRIE